ncbi:cupredoxin domain-containing protein [Paracraurococcus lichenis]|uniref:Cupredoxin family copper-binding protein n=1 Tax=Paracraurococcus lichenis TaxID=3064888 RepID=A0ABT9DV22_9PROT|nr:cupredoxin family copper-binding protein [Paracraurococcus sp. LOR1-02]MDO9707749.1 cupredoxin family copper-binding protein [Paracraurococcus sp. LOR1-02]
MLPRRAWLAALLLPLRPARAAAAEVVIDDFAFQPAELRVAPGTTVRWTNREDSPHNVVSQETPRLFRSRLMEAGESFAFTFDQPGEHAYYCALHPHMTGRVVVA